MATKQVWTGLYEPLDDKIPDNYPKHNLTITVELSDKLPDVWGGLVAMAPFHSWFLAEYVELGPF